MSPEDYLRFWKVAMAGCAGLGAIIALELGLIIALLWERQ